MYQISNHPGSLKFSVTCGKAPKTVVGDIPTEGRVRWISRPQAKSSNGLFLSISRRIYTIIVIHMATEGQPGMRITVAMGWWVAANIYSSK
jgi:hypothetical protein